MADSPPLSGELEFAQPSSEKDCYPSGARQDDGACAETRKSGTPSWTTELFRVNSQDITAVLIAIAVFFGAGLLILLSPTYATYSNTYNVTGQYGAPANFPHRFTINLTQACAYPDGRDLSILDQATVPLDFYILNWTWNYTTINATVFVKSNDYYFTVRCGDVTDQSFRSNGKTTFCKNGGSGGLYNNTWVVSTNNPAAGGIVDLCGTHNGTLTGSPTAVRIAGLACLNFTLNTQLISGNSWAPGPNGNVSYSFWNYRWGNDGTQGRAVGEAGSGTSQIYPGGVQAGGCGGGTTTDNRPTVEVYDGATFRCARGAAVNINQLFHMGGTWGYYGINATVNGTNVSSYPGPVYPTGNTVSIFGQAGVTAQTAVCELIRFKNDGKADLFAYEANETFMIAVPTSPLAGTITLSSPANGGIYANYTTLLNFTGVSSSLSTFPCWRNVNGTVTGLGNSTNNTLALSTFSQNAGVYGANVTCEMSPGLNITSSSAVYSVRDYLITPLVFNNYIYETQPNYYNTSVFTAQNISNVTTWGQLNGVNTSVSYLSSNGTAWTSAILISSPLVGANASGLSIFIWHNITYLNGTSVLDTQSSTVIIYWGAFVEQLSLSPTNMTVGTNFTAFTRLSLPLASFSASRNVTYFFNNTNLQSYLYSSNSTHETWLTWFIAPSPIPSAQTFFTNSSLNVTFLGRSVLRNSSAQNNMTIWIPNVYACQNATDTIVLALTPLSEESPTTTYFNYVEWNLTFQSGSYIFGYTNTTLGSTWAACTTCHYLCMTPFFATLNTTGILKYYNNTPGYARTREYYFYSAPLTNTTSSVSLYDIFIGNETNVSVEVTDANGIKADNVYVQYQRYYVGENLYRTVAMSLSSSAAASIVPLRCNDVWYRMIGSQYGQVVFNYYPVQLPCSTLVTPTPSISLAMQTSTEKGIWTYFNSVYANCALSNSTGTLTCTVVDTTGLGTASSLVVTQFGALTNTTVCSNSNAGTAATTFICNLGNTTDSSYSYYVTARVGGTDYTIQSGSFGGTSTVHFGMIGYLLALFVLIAVAVVGFFNPAVFVVLSFLGVVIATLFGFFPLALGAIVGLFVMGFLVIMVMKT